MSVVLVFIHAAYYTKFSATNKPEANAFLKAPKRGDWDFAKMMAGREARA